MINDQQKTIELYDKVRTMLMEQGLSYWEAFEAVRELDLYVYNLVCREIVSGLDEEKHKELEKLMEINTPVEVISEFLGITMEEMQSKYAQKLEEYVIGFPAKLEELKHPKTASANPVQPS